MNQSFENELQGMALAFRRRLPQTVAALCRTWQSVRAEPDAQAHWTEFERLAHSLAGAGASFGVSEMSALARAIDAAQRRGRNEAATVAHVETLLAQIEAMAMHAVADAGATVGAGARVTGSPAPVQPGRGTGLLVYVVDDDAACGDSMAVQLRASGYEVVAMETLDAFRQAMATRLPDAILMDMVLREGPLAGAEAIVAHVGSLPVPVIFASVRDDFESRLAAVRAGAAAYLLKPVEPSRLIEQLDQVIHRHPQVSYRVLVIEDVESLAILYQRVLTQAGIDVRVLSSAVGALAVVESFEPELLLLDVNLPEVSGLEFGAIIRQYEQYSNVPIVFLTGDAQIATRSGALQLGGDDFLLKPVDNDFLVESLLARLKRARTQRQNVAALRQSLANLDLMRRELEREAERLALAMSATETGFWEWNRKTGLVEYSESWRTLLGYSQDRNDIVWADLTHPDDFRKNVDALHAHISGESPIYNVECRVKNAHGEWDWVAEVGRVVEHDDTGRPTRIVGTTQLINKRMAMEEQKEHLQIELMQAQKMEAMGHLSAGIAHDFNNMLGAILGYAELSRELLLRPNSADKVGRYLGEVLTAGTRAKELVAQMLVFSRLNPTQQEGEETPVALLMPIIKEVAQLLRSSIPATIDVNYHIDDETLRARIQPVHLHQILLNLGINARDALGEYGQIRIGIARHPGPGRCASCRHPFSGDYVAVTVKDSGHGIPEHLLGKIFDPFFTTKAVGKGTGMGLSVVHGVVHGLGGHILVDSQPGAGTTLTVLLPQVEVGAGDTPHAADDGHPINAGALAGLRIMVVDDERSMGAMLKELLGLRGAEVRAFDQPLVALEEFLRDPLGIDLLITDEAMPELSGMDMAKTMLAARPGLPIILCTGYSAHANAETAAKAGIAAFMNKPLEINALVETVEKVIREESLS